MMKPAKKLNGMPACAGMTEFSMEAKPLTKNRHTRAGGCHVFWFSLFPLLLLAACGERPVAFAPVPVDMPVAVACKVPGIPAPSAPMAALPKDATLASGMKACLQDDLLEHAYADQLAVALAACR